MSEGNWEFSHWENYLEAPTKFIFYFFKVSIDC